MVLNVDDEKYDVVIERKITNKNTYIRVKEDLSIYVTTNTWTKDKEIEELITSNYNSIVKMITNRKIKLENNDGFNYLGKHYDIVYINNKDIIFGEEKVFISKGFDIDKWLKKQAKIIFLEHLEDKYNSFNKNIPHPMLKIRKMTSRWGVCNTTLHTITLNLELIKRDPKYLDYVIVHELSHLVYADHSKNFWALVEENYPGHKKIKKEMKEF